MKKKNRYFWTLFIILSAILVWIIGAFSFLLEAYKYKSQTQSQLILPSNTKTEVIVVLTGGRNRITKGLELLRSRGSRLIISGVAKGVSLTEIIKNQKNAATDIHTTWEKVTLETSSNTTLENAEHVQQLINSSPPKHIILVTSYYHMVRALHVFKEFFPAIEIIPFATTADQGLEEDEFWKIFFEYHKYILQLLF